MKPLVVAPLNSKLNRLLTLKTNKNYEQDSKHQQQREYNHP